MLRRLACALWSGDDEAFLKRFTEAEEILSSPPERNQLIPPELMWLSRLACVLARAIGLRAAPGLEADQERAALTQTMFSASKADTPDWVLRLWSRRFLPASGGWKYRFRVAVRRLGFGKGPAGGQAGTQGLIGPLFSRNMPTWVWVVIVVAVLSVVRTCAVQH